jgi:hypothetical protein
MGRRQDRFDVRPAGRSLRQSPRRGRHRAARHRRNSPGDRSTGTAREAHDLLDDAVIYLSYTPRPPLHAFVERLWLVADGQAPRKERILPSGTIQLVVNLRDDQVRIEGTVDSPRVRTCSGVAVSGTYSGVFIIDAMQHAAMMGAHVRPGAASAVLGVPPCEFADAHVDLSALWGDAAARALRDRLCDAATHEARFQLLESVLAARLQLPLRRHPVVPFALERFRPTGLGMSVREVARQAGLSYRLSALSDHLHRRGGSHAQAVLPHPPLPAHARAGAADGTDRLGPTGTCLRLLRSITSVERVPEARRTEPDGIPAGHPGTRHLLHNHIAIR